MYSIMRLLDYLCSHERVAKETFTGENILFLSLIINFLSNNILSVCNIYLKSNLKSKFSLIEECINSFFVTIGWVAK